MNEELFDGSLDIDPTLGPKQTFSYLAALPSCKGIVLFADSEHRPIQLLIATDIRRTARARLHTEDDNAASKRPEIASIVRFISYVCCYSDFKAAWSHFTIAKTLWPDNYLDLVSFPKLSLAKINPSAKWPNFSIVSSPSLSNDDKIFGPFQTRKSATEFVNALENAFSLCQRSELAGSPEKAASCPYLQMDNCQAPCIGKISRSDYQQQIENAISAASGNCGQIKADLHDNMKLYSDEMKFELASHVKNQIEQLELLGKYAFKWTGELKRLAVLHINLSAKVKIKGNRTKIQTFAAFLITAANIHEFEPFRIEEIDQFRNSLSEKSAVEYETEDRKACAENLALACSFLYRRKPAGIWINCSPVTGRSVPNASTLENKINKLLENKPKRIF